ncbi:ATP-binding cassette domain-containing protein [Corynebacterium urinipleomorphum]|uniref:ATP-binding cassette domain-containing protein n=1 Tax=Corynebacterium urinipleomorphum TaxID=1852380 RepID=UPI000B362941|nr:ABC transporter ATP-binding protein [Corynebacterium urinipleomorphum]
MITARNLTKSFREKTVLDDVNLDIEPGGIHGLLGRNGVGKSTLLSLIAGQLKPTFGELLVFGRTPFDDGSVMDRVALTGVDVAYPGSWSVRDILTGAQLRYPAWDSAIAEDLARDFALDGAMKTGYGELSRGQRAMVGNIVGLASGAELTLLDEPYVGLDVHNTGVFYRHLLEFSGNGRTFIMATHHIEDAAKLLDSALILGRDGQVAAHISAEEADNYVIAVGSFDAPASAIAYRRTDAGSRALLPFDAASGLNARITPADLGNVIDSFLEES